MAVDHGQLISTIQSNSPIKFDVESPMIQSEGSYGESGDSNESVKK